MAPSVILKRIQASPEWGSQQAITAVRDFVESRQAGLPLVHPPCGQRRFNNADWYVNATPNRTFHYRPRVVAGGPPRLDLLVANPTEHNMFLAETRYNSPRECFGIGINMFYLQVCARYVGITRRECAAFLMHKGNYQVTCEYHKIPNRSTISKTSSKKWEIDHTNFNCFYSSQHLPTDSRRTAWTFVNQHDNNSHIRPSHNLHSFKFIFVCVDTFSKKVWATQSHGT